MKISDLLREHARRTELVVPEAPEGKPVRVLMGVGDSICEEIGGYIAKEGASFQIRMDRGAAIREAILGAVPGEVVLILGKGADVTMHVGNGNVPYRSDAVYAKEARAEYGNAFAEAATARETEE